MEIKSKHSYFNDVYELVRLVPRGRVSTYGMIADCLALGSARMVGWALNHSFSHGADVPAHRIVNRKGELSGRMHFPSPTMMQELLEEEGIKIENHKVVDFEIHLFNPVNELL